MGKIIISFVFIVSFFCIKPEVYAQLDSLSRGDHIRITASKYFYQPTITTFEKLHSDSLLFNMNARTSAIPIQYLQKVELSIGKKRHTVTGLIVGSVFGGLILGISMNVAEQNAEGFGKIGQPGFWGGFVSGALIGGGVGALIGHQIHSERWREITISAR